MDDKVCLVELNLIIITIVLEHILLLIKILIAQVMADKPEWVIKKYKKEQIYRDLFIKETLNNKIKL